MKKSIVWLMVLLPVLLQAQQPKTKTVSTTKTLTSPSVAIKKDITEKPLLGKIRLNAMSLELIVSFGYDKNKRLEKVNYNFSTGRQITDQLSYDEKGKLYLIATEKREQGRVYTYYRVFIFDDQGRVKGINQYGTNAEIHSKSFFRYEGNKITKTYQSARGTLNLYYTMSEDGGNIISMRDSTQALPEFETLSFSTLNDPAGYINKLYSSRLYDDTYTDEYSGYKGYVFKGNRLIASNTKRPDIISKKVQFNKTERELTNAKGWVESVVHYSESDDGRRSNVFSIHYEYIQL